MCDEFQFWVQNDGQLLKLIESLPTSLTCSSEEMVRQWRDFRNRRSMSDEKWSGRFIIKTEEIISEMYQKWCPDGRLRFRKLPKDFPHFRRPTTLFKQNLGYHKSCADGYPKGSPIRKRRKNI